MSLPDNYVTVSHHNISHDHDDNKALSVPCSGRNSDLRKDRSIEEFLKSKPLTDTENPNKDDNESVTVKDCESHNVSILSESQGEHLTDQECHSNKTDDKSDENQPVNEIQTHSVSIDPPKTNIESNSNVTDSSLNAEHLNEQSKHSQRSSSPVLNGDSPQTNEFSAENREKIATPTIKFTKKPKQSPESLKENKILKNEEESSNFEEFAKKLDHMSNLIQQKDEEIKKLSKKLKEIETKNKSKKRSSSSSSSSSSDETNKSSDKKTKEKKSKDKKKKPKETKEKKKTKEKKDSANENIFKKTEEKIDQKIEILENQVKLEDGIVLSKSPCVEEDSKIKSLSTEEALKNKDKLTADLRKKLEELESEVRRLQQANVDSILTFQKLQDHNVKVPDGSNETVINQLLVDYNLLKEELKQLKWDQSKLTDTGIIMDQINQLKEDMLFLRKQNEFLKNFTKQSSRSLGHLSSSSYHTKDFKDFTDTRHKDRKSYLANFPDSNNNSNYMYQKVHSNRLATSDASNLQKMLRNNIESLESPYHATCQSIQHSAPFSGGPTYRPIKVSDFYSSVLIEDTKPKSWIETVPKNYLSIYHKFPKNYQSAYDHPAYRDFDEQSQQSYVSVTTSVTEKSDDEWRIPTQKRNEVNSDLLSTEETEFSESSYLNDEPNLPIMSRVEYSFTPKKPSDLNLEDVVKFVRPGGKMSTGRVCFIGHLPGRNEVCVGLELGEDAGKHDGLFEGTRYFQCRKNRGVFISFHKIILAYKSI